ncbi:keratin-associated protein 10-8-like [Manacus candei]|uniref:keratin-associated protein 10-8-like n=1 Tax=Manacus candei TaxID=415023 RepID=UPI002227D3D0|nr:keratin-associated protein 10-8-like [Manacus candei]XP_051654199.1 keratin-associated protein 10-8-like [Manacus candei]XP_051654200.1 keratin-associated protein 10-8-like [Manacus candei]XP_051654201.1 keratin-associated protein 10-8-like [Manacus candei]XP_051654202.1 keratin-associated protein 10-8-like [Manacus candei]
MSCGNNCGIARLPAGKGSAWAGLGWAGSGGRAAAPSAVGLELGSIHNLPAASWIPPAAPQTTGCSVWDPIYSIPSHWLQHLGSHLQHPTPLPSSSGIPSAASQTTGCSILYPTCSIPHHCHPEPCILHHCLQHPVSCLQHPTPLPSCISHPIPLPAASQATGCSVWDPICSISNRWMQCLDPIYSVPHHCHSVSCIPPHCLQHPKLLAATSWIPSAASHTTAIQNPASCTTVCSILYPACSIPYHCHPASCTAACSIPHPWMHHPASHLQHPSPLPAASLIPRCSISPHCLHHPTSHRDPTACTIPHPSPLPAAFALLPAASCIPDCNIPHHFHQHPSPLEQHSTLLPLTSHIPHCSIPHPWLPGMPHGCPQHP